MVGDLSIKIIIICCLFSPVGLSFRFRIEFYLSIGCFTHGARSKENKICNVTQAERTPHQIQKIPTFPKFFFLLDFPEGKIVTTCK